MHNYLGGGNWKQSSTQDVSKYMLLHRGWRLTKLSKIIQLFTRSSCDILVHATSKNLWKHYTAISSTFFSMNNQQCVFTSLDLEHELGTNCATDCRVKGLMNVITLMSSPLITACFNDRTTRQRRSSTSSVLSNHSLQFNTTSFIIIGLPMVNWNFGSLIDFILKNPCLRVTHWRVGMGRDLDCLIVCICTVIQHGLIN